MQEHPNYKYRPRRRKHNKRAGSLGASPPRVQPRTPYTAYGGPYTPVGLHTPDSSPTASPEPETASAPGLLEDPTNPASNLPTPEMSPMEQVSLIYERLLNFQINQGWIQSFGSISSSPSIWFTRLILPWELSCKLLTVDATQIASCTFAVHHYSLLVRVYRLTLDTARHPGQLVSV